MERYTLAAFAPLFFAISLLFAVPAAFGGELKRQVWPTPTESQLGDEDEVSYLRFLNYIAAIGQRVTDPQERENLKFVGVRQLRLVTARPETGDEIKARRDRVLLEGLAAGRARGGMTGQEIADLLARVAAIN